MPCCNGLVDAHCFERDVRCNEWKDITCSDCQHRGFSKKRTLSLDLWCISLLPELESLDGKAETFRNLEKVPHDAVRKTIGKQNEACDYFQKIVSRINSVQWKPISPNRIQKLRAHFEGLSDDIQPTLQFLLGQLGQLPTPEPSIHNVINLLPDERELGKSVVLRVEQTVVHSNFLRSAETVFGNRENFYLCAMREQTIEDLTKAWLTARYTEIAHEVANITDMAAVLARMDFTKMPRVFFEKIEDDFQRLRADEKLWEIELTDGDQLWILEEEIDGLKTNADWNSLWSNILRANSTVLGKRKRDSDKSAPRQIYTSRGRVQEDSSLSNFDVQLQIWISINVYRKADTESKYGKCMAEDWSGFLALCDRRREAVDNIRKLWMIIKDKGYSYTEDLKTQSESVVVHAFRRSRPPPGKRVNVQTARRKLFT
ncbi:MAG: hypothetical protein Q9227_007384 [Pyrenula ochraceoflavens]